MITGIRPLCPLSKVRPAARSLFNGPGRWLRALQKSFETYVAGHGVDGFNGLREIDFGHKAEHPRHSLRDERWRGRFCYCGIEA